MLLRLCGAGGRPESDFLAGRVEVDDCYIGGSETGLSGRLNLDKILPAVAREEAARSSGGSECAQINYFRNQTMHALPEDSSMLGWTDSRTPARGINRKHFSHGCREKASSFPPLVWSRLKIHQMPTVMVDIRSCDSWWQRNGEAVYCTHEF
jgi:hypothetical protein